MDNTISTEISLQEKELANLKAQQFMDGRAVKNFIVTSAIMSGTIPGSPPYASAWRFTYTFGASGYFLGSIGVLASINSDLSNPAEPSAASGGYYTMSQNPQVGNGTVTVDCLAYSQYGATSQFYMQATASGDMPGTFSFQKIY